MIVFDLRCEEGHVFEAWFGSSEAFEEQRARGIVSCPICGDDSVEKAVMAPRLGARGNSGSAISSDQVKSALSVMAKAQRAALKDSRWVGRGFAEQARAMHDGERVTETIHGQATRDEARTLAEEGVPVMPLIVPVTPPERTN